MSGLGISLETNGAPTQQRELTAAEQEGFYAWQPMSFPSQPGAFVREPAPDTTGLVIYDDGADDIPTGDNTYTAADDFIGPPAPETSEFPGAPWAPGTTRADVTEFHREIEREKELASRSAEEARSTRGGLNRNLLVGGAVVVGLFLWMRMR